MGRKRSHKVIATFTHAGDAELYRRAIPKYREAKVEPRRINNRTVYAVWCLPKR